MGSAFLSRKRAAVCILAGLCAISVFIINISGKSIRAVPVRDEVYAVIQAHHGIDAAEMERTAAVPLEDALARLRGVKKIHSVSENGQVRVFVYFEGKSAGRYEAVREAAQSVYETLPSSAQRPEISGSGESRIPVWIAAVSAAGEIRPGPFLERIIKPALEGLEGVGEAEISGAGLTEIIIALDDKKAAAAGVDPRDAAEILAYNDVLLPGGHVMENGREISIMVDGRYKNLEELKTALLPSGRGKHGFTALNDIAVITERERPGSTRARLNGRETAVIAVMAASGADLAKLSGAVKKELEKYDSLPLEFTVLSDRGAEEAEAFRSVLGAALQGTLAVAVLAMLLCSGGKSSFNNLRPARGTGGRRGGISRALVCACTVPVTCLLAAAALCLLGIPLDKLALAGLSAGVGAAVDAAIISAERFAGCSDLEQGRRALFFLRFPLISGAATTIIALLPLILGAAETGITPVAWSVAAVNFFAMVLALTLLPPLFLWNVHAAAESESKPAATVVVAALTRMHVKPGRSDALTRMHVKAGKGGVLIRMRIKQMVRRTILWNVWLCRRKPFFVIAFWAALTVLGVIVLVSGGADTGTAISENSVYAQVEFDGGLHIDETDRRLASYSAALTSQAGIIHVQSSARTGSGSVMVTFNSAEISPAEARELLRSVPVQEGFVYIHESSEKERIWEITISGGEAEKCRELAAEGARLCASLPLVLETVLNFKEGPPRLTLRPDRYRVALQGLSSVRLGTALRRYVHGPVIYKRTGSEEETDVRLSGVFSPVFDAAAGTAEIFSVVISGNSGPVPLDTLVSTVPGQEPQSLRREDRRRSASFSVRTGAEDPRRVRDRIMPVLRGMELPPGYVLRFDPEAIKAAEQVSGQAGLFILSLAFCYMVMAAVKESLTVPLLILAVVPPSLAFPALYLGLSGHAVNAASAAAFVAVSGMAVNAAVLVADAFQSYSGGIYGVLKKCLPVLAVTAGTTIAGALPFLCVGNSQAEVVRVLSLVSVLGVGASALCSLTLIPAILDLFKN